MTDAEKLAQLRLRLGEEENEDVLTGYLSDAEALIRALAWRRDVPESLHNAVVRLAAVFYARRGAAAEFSVCFPDGQKALFTAFVKTVWLGGAQVDEPTGFGAVLRVSGGVTVQ